VRIGGTIKIDGSLLPVKVVCVPLRLSPLCQVSAELKKDFVRRRATAHGANAKPSTLGHLSATVAAGKTKVLKLRLNKAARALLRKRHSLNAHLTVKITQGAAKTTVTRNVKLVLKKKPHRKP
jgi:hypothetical protein